MNKEEYIAKSKKETRLVRCPIYGRCRRSIDTLHVLSELNRVGKEETVEDDLIAYDFVDSLMVKDPIPFVGSGFIAYGNGKNSLSFNNGCPEVPLLAGRLYAYIPPLAISAGSWDNEKQNRGPGRYAKFDVEEFKHFTDCAEYSIWEVTRGGSSEKEPTTKEPESEHVNQDITKFVPDGCPQLTFRQAAYLIAYNKGIFADHRSDNGEMKELAKALCQRTCPTSGGGLHNKYAEVRSPAKRRELFKKTVAACAALGKPPRLLKEILESIEPVLPFVWDEYKPEAEKDLHQWKELQSKWAQ